MKNSKYIIFALALSSLGVLSTGCQSSSEKVDDAKANVAEAKEELKEVVKDANAEMARAANAEEWRVFKNETELAIKDTENRIAEIRTKMKSSGKNMDAVYSKKIDNLEESIKDLKSRVYVYETNQSDWASFKREFNHDMDELGQALKDLTVNNKK